MYNNNCIDDTVRARLASQCNILNMFIDTVPYHECLAGVCVCVGGGLKSP